MQIRMARAYWENNPIIEQAVFDLVFQKNPGGGELPIFTELGKYLDFLENFHYNDDDNELVRSLIPDIEDEFLTYLRSISFEDGKLFTIEEGKVGFPRVHLIRIEGSLIKVQFLEATLLILGL